MATPREFDLEPLPEELLADDLTEFFMDDEMSFEDIEEGPDEAERSLDFGGERPTWRLIEMAREDRYLKDALADFEDYDVYGSSDGFPSEYAH